MRYQTTVLILLSALSLAACAGPSAGQPAAPAKRYAVTKTDAEWKAALSPEQYRILRQKGTEPAFRNAYWDYHGTGTFLCAACDQELFSADDKFDSGTGWPSFTRPIRPDAVDTGSDRSLGIERTEVVCGRCGGHLGHVFDDGPRPTGLRYCMNSGAMTLRK